jgi:hypothetical protein
MEKRRSRRNPGDGKRNEEGNEIEKGRRWR